MRKIGAYVTLGALAAIICSPPPAAAFGLRVGPFHIGLPYFGWHHRHRLYMNANPGDVEGRGASPEAAGQARVRRWSIPTWRWRRFSRTFSGRPIRRHGRSATRRSSTRPLPSACRTRRRSSASLLLTPAPRSTACARRSRLARIKSCCCESSAARSMRPRVLWQNPAQRPCQCNPLRACSSWNRNSRSSPWRSI